ncbi:serine/threonine-protein kinase [Actinokineospora sp. UTMC 2448]|uniref:serine/threonine-protein kinase n=1 Tax=Actinokineospora sp. UTMC 2448 TaxID=2268449 RepID=UPI00220FA311|nr:serine/threonine-protein kinase [Actinokineospora sp. UTMC 2448]UVS79888.1 Serine/threonine-protein kinase AfsK [Actinokineospora sp. UTMC 2448]
MAELDAVGAYRIVGRLGGGAMGTVHLARSPGGRLVAVKVVRPELADDPRFRERFRREIAMARAVGGFWTAAVVDADPDAARPWLATEYIPGLDLHEAVRSTGALPPDAVRGLAAGLAEALCAIHAAGLVHRDLKPSNVLLAADGPRVIDFGISKALEGSGLTHTGMVVGTPGYLSPEQIEGREVGPPSDVFAFGAVVAFAASGRHPFGDGDTAALLYRAVHTRPDLRDVPHDVRELISSCLDRKPRNRPTAPDLVTALRGRVAGEWLPANVRTLVEERRTAIIAAHPPTRTLPHDDLSPRARWWLERGEPAAPPGGLPEAPPGPGLLRRLMAKAGQPLAPDNSRQAEATPQAGQLSAAAPGGAFRHQVGAGPTPQAGQPRAAASADGSRQLGGAEPNSQAALPDDRAGTGPQAWQAPHPSHGPAGVGRAAHPEGQPEQAAAASGAGRLWQMIGGLLGDRPATTEDRSTRGPMGAVSGEQQADRPVEASSGGSAGQRADRHGAALSGGFAGQRADRHGAALSGGFAGQPAVAVGVQEPGVFKRWWALSKIRAPQPELKVADRVGRLVEQARGRGDRGQAVFVTARGPRVVAAVVGFGGAGLLAAAGAEAGRNGRPGVGLLVLAVAVLLALVAVRRAGQAVGPRRRVEVGAAGLSWRRGATVTTVKWPKVARVRIVGDKHRPWLVVWPRDPSALPGKPDHHGGYRVYPIAHEKQPRRRERELAELRAALAWYGRSAFDES